MKVLLINPPIPHHNMVRDYADGSGTAAIIRENEGPPLALNDLAGILRDEVVRILDLKTLFDRNPNCDLEKEIYGELKGFEPDIVGITCMTAQVYTTLKIFRIVKDFNQKILTIVGGIHPTSCPDDFGVSDIDLIVRGLGKLTLRRVVDVFKRDKTCADFSSIPGLAKNENGVLRFTRQLSALTRQEIMEEHYCYDMFPDRSLTDRYDYRIRYNNSKIHYLNTSIGCTNRCNFCYLWKFYNGKYICRPIDSIIAELKTMEAYPIIRFCDAHTFGDIRSADKLFRTILEEGINHLYVVDARTDSIASFPDVWLTAARAGLKVAIIGLEATTNEELAKYEKNSTIRTTEEAIKILHGSGVWISGNYIINCDYDEKDFDQLARFVEGHPLFFSGFTILTPFPGTKQYEMLKDKITIKNLDYYNLTNAVIETKLPEKTFHQKVNELYQVGLTSREKFLSLYKSPARKEG